MALLLLSHHHKIVKYVVTAYTLKGSPSTQMVEMYVQRNGVLSQDWKSIKWNSCFVWCSFPQDSLELDLKRICSELSCVNHMDKLQYLLRCHVRYIARLCSFLFPLPLWTNREVMKTQSVPLWRMLAAKSKLVNNSKNLFLYKLEHLSLERASLTGLHSKFW